MCEWEDKFIMTSNVQIYINAKNTHHDANLKKAGAETNKLEAEIVLFHCCPFWVRRTTEIK